MFILASECQNNLKLTAMLFLLTYAVLNKLKLKRFKDKVKFSLILKEASNNWIKNQLKISKKKKFKPNSKCLNQHITPSNPQKERRNHPKKKKTGNLPNWNKNNKKKSSRHIIIYRLCVWPQKKKKRNKLKDYKNIQGQHFRVKNLTRVLNITSIYFL